VVAAVQFRPASGLFVDVYGIMGSHGNVRAPRTSEVTCADKDTTVTSQQHSGTAAPDL
jgi:hypothetical protein